MSFPKQPLVKRPSLKDPETQTEAPADESTTAVTMSQRRGSTDAGYSTANVPQGGGGGGFAPPPSNRGCCFICCAVICSCLGHDRIYGSFIGPHPVNFMSCCCKCCCGGARWSTRPFALASISTKLMWFLMLFFITILACFFIIPYPESKYLNAVGHFWPCGDYQNGTWVGKNVSNHITGNCGAHGGYFMVYRVFLSYILLLVFHCLLMIGVKSVNNNPLRAKIHHGFWFYKYFCLVALLLLCFLAIRVEGGGAFEYTMSWFGLIGSVIFSFIELTMLLDVVEMLITRNRNSKSDRAGCWYWFVTALVVIYDLFLVVMIGVFYLANRKSVNYEWSTEKVSVIHLVIYLYGIFLSVGIIGISIWAATRKKDYYGILRCLFVVAYVQGLIWETVSVSPDIYARPTFNLYNSTLQHQLQNGNKDTYFKADGCFQGLSCIVTLMYYLFWHGPRSPNAPLSILFDRIWYCNAEKPFVPVIPKKLSTSDEDHYCMAVQQFKVWEDETFSVRYSWTIFYVIMILGSFTLMMSMTNFSDPWAVQWFCSSYPALGMKLAATVFVTGLYFLVTFTITTKVSPDDEQRKSLEEALKDEESAISNETSTKLESITDSQDSEVPSKKDSVGSSEAPTTVALPDQPVNNNLNNRSE